MGFLGSVGICFGPRCIEFDHHFWCHAPHARPWNRKSVSLHAIAAALSTHFHFALLTLVFSIVFVAGAVATADWCHNGPDAKVSYLLNEYQDNVDSVIYQFARYYVNTCDSELAPIRIVTQSELSLNITTQVSGLLSQINTFDEAVWREECGDSLTGLRVILEGLVGGLCVLGQTVEDLNRYFWCRNWNPVYGFFMHDGICQDATEGIGWIAAAMFWVRTFHSLWIGKK